MSPRILRLRRRRRCRLLIVASGAADVEAISGGIHVTIDLLTDSPSDFVDTDSRRSVRGAPGSTGQSLPSESHFGRCHTPAISAASSLSISSDCCGLRGLGKFGFMRLGSLLEQVVDMTLEFMVELGQVVDMTLALVLVMVEQEGELTEAEQFWLDVLKPLVQETWGCC
ncbi:hypothetical protein SASPL_117977 [Salvia splendens]|uniref:Uncharacterized protein n=1 Tax=Salvia splendens TaxID=180675 RepID=A0A8X8XVW5_SALSN|nr:hypothetical protein SASPL_117977 [Salvia splendens]